MFYPKEEYGSAYLVPYEEFYKKGYRAIIFDIDNTLVPHGAPADERAEKLCNNLRAMGFKMVLLSNNGKRRVQSFAREVGGIPCIYNAGKPLTKGYLLASSEMRCKPEETLFVGDQLLTDVIGANRAGCYSILVGPINRTEKFWIVWKRKIETVGLFFYRHSKKYKGDGSDREGYEDNIPEEYQ